MRKFLTVLIISAIYFAWIGGVCLADTRGPLLPRESPVVGPLGDGIQGPEYYPPVETISVLGFSLQPVGFADIAGTGSNGDAHRITPVLDYFSDTGRVTLRAHNAKTGVFDPSALWKNVWIQSGYSVFTGDAPVLPANATNVVDTDTTLSFVLPNPESTPDGYYDFGNIAQAGLSESDFIGQNWTITGNARSSFEDRGSATPSFVGSVVTYNGMPVPEPDFLAMGTPLVLFGLFRLWLLGRRMR
jgi:hypothetical protein